MPLYDHHDLGEVTRHVYFRGTILEVDTGNDLAKVTIPALTGGSGGWDWIPIYYHCQPDSAVRANGALEGSGAAFKPYDEVVVRYRFRGSRWSPVHVVGFADGRLAPCGFFDQCFIIGNVLCYADGTSIEDTDIRLLIKDFYRRIQMIRVTQSDWVIWNVNDFIIAVNYDNCHCPHTCGPDAVDYFRGQYILSLVNSLRSDLGINPLTLNKFLYDAAVRHADDLAENCYIEHYGSDGSTVRSRIEDAGYADSAAPGSTYELGENIALARNDDEAMAGWINSPGHYANLIYSGYYEMGLAVVDVSHCESFYDVRRDEYLNLAATGESWYIYVQTFGRKTPSPWTIIPVEID